MSEKGQTIFHHSIETPMVPLKPIKKRREKINRRKRVVIPKEQIRGIEVDRVDIDRAGGKQPRSGEVEVDPIDIERHRHRQA